MENKEDQLFKAIDETVGSIEKKVAGAADVLADFVGHRPRIDAKGTVFVTGATGVVGHRVAKRLLELYGAVGYPTVRIGTTSPKMVDDLGLEGGDITEFSWDQEEYFAQALEGVQTVFCVMPYMNEWQKKFPPFLKACKAAGVQYFIKLSFCHARISGDSFQDVPLVNLHGDLDEMLQNSGIPFTILSASHFMSNVMVFQGHTILKDEKPAVFYGASANRGVNYVSPNDVSEVAVRVILDPRPHVGKELMLTGPQAISDHEVAKYLGQSLEKPVMYVDQTLDTFERTERKAGEPAWLVKDLVALEKVKATGKEEDVAFVAKDISEICGHPAETFEQYLEKKESMTPRELGVTVHTAEKLPQ